MITLARNRVNDRNRDVSTEETARIFCKLVVGLPALAEKDMFVVLTAYMYVGSFTNNRYLDDWILKLVLTRQILEIPKDRPKKDKNCPILGKAYMFKERLLLGGGFERQGLVCFLEPRDFDDPGSKDLINEELSRTSGTRRARGMSEDGAEIRTRPIKSDTTVL